MFYCIKSIVLSIFLFWNVMVCPAAAYTDAIERAVALPASHFDDMKIVPLKTDLDKWYERHIKRLAIAELLDIPLSISHAIANLEHIKTHFENQIFNFTPQSIDFMALPVELIEQISTYCDLRTLAALRLTCHYRCACVNKLWCQAIIQYWGGKMISESVRLGYDHNIKKLLDLGVSPNTFGDPKKGNAPMLYIACDRARHISYEDIIIPSSKAVSILLEAKADPNVREIIEGETPLMIARCEDSALLLLYKADPDTSLIGGATALIIATRMHDKSKIRLLSSAKAKH